MVSNDDRLSVVRVSILEDIELLLLGGGRPRRLARRTALATSAALRLGRGSLSLLAKTDDACGELSLGVLVTSITVAGAIRLGALDTDNGRAASLW